MRYASAASKRVTSHPPSTRLSPRNLHPLLSGQSQVSCKGPAACLDQYPLRTLTAGTLRESERAVLARNRSSVESVKVAGRCLTHRHRCIGSIDDGVSFPDSKASAYAGFAREPGERGELPQSTQDAGPASSPLIFAHIGSDQTGFVLAITAAAVISRGSPESANLSSCSAISWILLSMEDLMRPYLSLSPVEAP